MSEKESFVLFCSDLESAVTDNEIQDALDAYLYREAKRQEREAA